MRTLTILVAAGLVLLGTVPTLARCDAAQVIQVGALGGDPEKDTFGLMCGPGDVEQTNSIARTHGQILTVGASTGDSEKDTLGYLQTASAQ